MAFWNKGLSCSKCGKRVTIKGPPQGNLTFIEKSPYNKDRAFECDRCRMVVCVDCAQDKGMRYGDHPFSCYCPHCGNLLPHSMRD